MITLPIYSIDSASRLLQERVALHLQNRQLTFGGRVKIEVKQGAVTLSGNVPTYYQRQMIYSATKHVAGVIKVVDQMSVEGSEDASLGGRIIA
ncbi:BON domain-containing protein [Anatilimnocola floriformis]|uniref:BON domain-containing protein n=1 Tax=Anatilimnocola floriformis TaxID=2948575 RepID=UPI0020C446D7|nr:BON domain-containing protein [Anatilimnocola floriformis]